MKIKLYLVWLACLAAPAAWASTDITVDTGNTINCVTARGEKGFNIDAWSLSGSDSVVFSFGGVGRTSSRPQISTLSLTKTLDACSAQLQAMFLSAHQLPSFTLTQYRTTADGIQAYVVVTLTDPAMTSYQIQASEDVRAAERVSFTFRKVCLKTTPTQTAHGSLGSSTTICYDRVSDITN